MSKPGDAGKGDPRKVISKFRSIESCPSTSWAVGSASAYTDTLFIVTWGDPPLDRGNVDQQVRTVITLSRFSFHTGSLFKLPRICHF